MKIIDIKCYVLEEPHPRPRCRWRKGLPIIDGHLTIPDTPGLGYEPDVVWLEKNAVVIV